MDDNQLESKIKKLRNSMENFPSSTDKSAIMQRLKQPKRKRNHSKLLVLTGSIASLVILALLVLSTLGNFDFANSDTAPSLDEPLIELLDVQVEVHSDEARLGSIGITSGEREGEKVVPTALSYEFTIQNVSDRTIGSLEEGEWNKKDFVYENGVQISIKPNDELIKESEEIMGYNLFNEEDRKNNFGGTGYIGLPIIEANQKGSYSLDFLLGASEENPELPLIPPDEQLQLLEEHAWNADLIVTLQDKEIARFDLREFKE
ncbi:hypothetical protein ACFQ3N_11790 [Virgibacillus byunsanensis]|uniref:DUF4352 domain-containing protein n=1 Tax=Virgibacillus byunsanensis TaxID=570945 RepID=A0ABW3LM98_9BACI